MVYGIKYHIPPHARSRQYMAGWCYKGERIESEVHKFFKEQRVNKQREFFRVTLEEAKSIIEEIGRKYI
jgi:hypothetical protein